MNSREWVSEIFGLAARLDTMSEAGGDTEQAFDLMVDDDRLQVACKALQGQVDMIEAEQSRIVREREQRCACAPDGTSPCSNWPECGGPEEA